jgi:hypothetical protein
MILLNTGKKNSLLFILITFVLTAVPLQAQNTDNSGNINPAEERPVHWYFGISGGYTNNQLYTSTANRAFTTYENGDGFAAAIPVRYQVNSWFALQAEFQFVQKNYVWERTGPFSRIYSEVTNSFIDFPLMAQFSFGGQKLRGFVNAGGFLGVWVDSRRKGTERTTSVDYWNPDEIYYYDYDEKMDFDTRRDNRFDAGLLLGGGVQYALKPCTFFIEGRYNFGLTDLQKKYAYEMVPRINDTFVIQCGVIFNHNLIQSFKGR